MMNTMEYAGMNALLAGSRISSNRRAYMTFAVLLTGSRSIAFGSGIQGGRGVLAIINSQFIDLCPPFGSFG